MIDKKLSPSIHTKFYIKFFLFEFKLLKPTLKQRLLSLDLNKWSLQKNLKSNWSEFVWSACYDPDYLHRLDLSIMWKIYHF